MNGVPDRDPDAGDLHGLSALYAVDALDASERSVFEAHLARCPQCRAEVAEYTETTSYLAQAVALDPPPALRTGVLDAIHGTFPLPARPDAEAAPPDTAVTRPASGATRAAAGRSPARATPEGPDRSGARPRRSHVSLDGLRRRYRRVLALAVATALVPGVAVGGWGLGVQAQQRQQEQHVAQEQDRENRLLAASDLTTHRIDVAGQEGRLLVSREQDAALFVSDELPDPGEEKEYQLWLLRGDTPVPDAHFGGGQLRTWLTGDVSDADAVAMTVEPAGGSTTPTLPLVASTDI